MKVDDLYRQTPNRMKKHHLKVVIYYESSEDVWASFVWLKDQHFFFFIFY